eukprot:8279287-Prorocentrum_lima.AAC.1
MLGYFEEFSAAKFPTLRTDDILFAVRTAQWMTAARALLEDQWASKIESIAWFVGLLERCDLSINEYLRVFHDGRGS